MEPEYLFTCSVTKAYSPSADNSCAKARGSHFSQYLDESVKLNELQVIVCQAESSCNDSELVRDLQNKVQQGVQFEIGAKEMIGYCLVRSASIDEMNRCVYILQQLKSIKLILAPREQLFLQSVTQLREFYLKFAKELQISLKEANQDQQIKLTLEYIEGQKIADGLEIPQMEALYVELLGILELLTEANLSSISEDSLSHQIKKAEDSLVNAIWLKKAWEIIKNQQQSSTSGNDNLKLSIMGQNNNMSFTKFSQFVSDAPISNDEVDKVLPLLIEMKKKVEDFTDSFNSAEALFKNKKQQQNEGSSIVFTNDEKILKSMLEDGSMESLKQKLVEVIERYRSLPSMFTVEVKQRQHVAQKILFKIEKLSKTEETPTKEPSNFIIEGRELSVESAAAVRKSNTQLFQMKEVYNQSLTSNEAKKKFNVQQFIDLFDTYKELSKYMNLAHSLAEVENFLKIYQHEEFALLKLSKGWISRINEQILPIKSFRKDFDQIKALMQFIRNLIFSYFYLLHRKKSIFEWNKYESNIKGLELVLRVREILEGESGEVSLKNCIELKEQIIQQLESNFIVKQFEKRVEFCNKLDEFIAIRNELTKAASDGVTFERLEEMQRVLQTSFLSCNAEKQRVNRMKIAKDKICSEMKEWNLLQQQGKRVSLARVQATYEVLKTSGLRMEDKKLQIEEIIEQGNKIIKLVKKGDSEDIIKEEYNKQNTAIEEVEEVMKESREIDNWLESINKSIGEYSQDYETLMDLNGKINQFKVRFQNKPLISIIKQKAFALLVVLIASSWKDRKKLFGLTQNALNQLFHDAKQYCGEHAERRNKGGLFGVLTDSQSIENSKEGVLEKENLQKIEQIFENTAEQVNQNEEEMKIEIEKTEEVQKCQTEEQENQCHLEGIFNLDKSEVGNSSDSKPVKEDEVVDKIVEEQQQEQQKISNTQIEEEVFAHLAASEEKCKEIKSPEKETGTYDKVEKSDKETIYFSEEKQPSMQVEYDNFEEVVGIIVNETEGAYPNLIKSCAETIKGLWEQMEERVKKITMASNLQDVESLEKDLVEIGCLDLSDLLIEQKTQLQSQDNDTKIEGNKQHLLPNKTESSIKKKKQSNINNSSIKVKSENKKDIENSCSTKKKNNSTEKSTKKRVLKDKNSQENNCLKPIENNEEVLKEKQNSAEKIILKENEEKEIKNQSNLQSKEEIIVEENDQISSDKTEMVCEDQIQQQQLQTSVIVKGYSDEVIENLVTQKWFMPLEEKHKKTVTEMARNLSNNKYFGESRLCFEIIEKTVQHFINKLIKHNVKDDEVKKFLQCLECLQEDQKLSLELRQSSFSYQCFKGIISKIQEEEKNKKKQNSDQQQQQEEDSIRKKRKINEEWLFDAEDEINLKEKKVIEHNEFVKLESIKFSNTQCSDPQVRELNKLLQSKEILAQFRRIKETTNRARGIDTKIEKAIQDIRINTDDEEDEDDDDHYQNNGASKKRNNCQAKFSSEDEDEEVERFTPHQNILKYSGDISSNKKLIDPIKEDEMEAFVEFCKQQLRIINPLLGQPTLFNPLEVTESPYTSQENPKLAPVLPMSEPQVECEQIFRIFSGKVHLRTETSQIPIKAICYTEALASQIKLCPVFKYGNTIVQSGESDLLETRQFLLKSFLCPQIISFFGFVESEFTEAEGVSERASSDSANQGTQIQDTKSDSHHQGQISLDSLAQDLKNRDRVSIGLWNSATKIYFFHRRILDANDSASSKISSRLTHSSSELCFAIIFKHSSIHTSDLESIPRLINPPAMSIQIFKELQALRTIHKNEAESVMKSLPSSATIVVQDKKEEDKSKFKKPLPKYRKDTVLRVYMPIQDENEQMDRSNPLNILLMPSNSQEVQKTLKKIEEKSKFLHHFRKPASTKQSVNRDNQAEVEEFFQRRLEGKMTAKQSLGRQQDIKLKVRKENEARGLGNEGILEELGGDIDHLQTTLTVSMNRIQDIEEDNQFDEPVEVVNQIEEINTLIRQKQISSIQRLIQRKTFRDEAEIIQDEEMDIQTQQEFTNQRGEAVRENEIIQEDYQIEGQDQEFIRQDEQTPVYRKKGASQALQNSIAKNRQKLLEFASILDSLRPNTKASLSSSIKKHALQSIEAEQIEEMEEIQEEYQDDVEEEPRVRSAFQEKRNTGAEEIEDDDNYIYYSAQKSKKSSANRFNNKFYSSHDKENNILESQRNSTPQGNISNIYTQDQEGDYQDDGLDTPQLSISKESYSNNSFSNKLSVTSAGSNKLSVSSIPKKSLTPASPFAPSQIRSFQSISNNSSVGQGRRQNNFNTSSVVSNNSQPYLGKRSFNNAFGNQPSFQQQPPQYQRNLFNCNDRVYTQNSDNTFTRVFTKRGQQQQQQQQQQEGYHQSYNQNYNNNRFANQQPYKRPRLGMMQIHNSFSEEDDEEPQLQYQQQNNLINKKFQQQQQQQHNQYIQNKHVPSNRRGIGARLDSIPSVESKIRESQLLDLRDQLDSLLNVIQTKRTYQPQ